MTLDFHPIANLFPMMEADDFGELVTDIKRNGLMEPIWTYEGKILDGRNRYMACQAANVKPRFKEYKDDNPYTFVVSMNIQRRHLTPTQRACIAVELIPLYKQAAKERMLAGKKTDPSQKVDEGRGRAIDFAAEAAKVNYQYVSDAQLVLKESPTLFAEMKAGLIHMKEALRKMKGDKREAARAEMAAAGAKVKPSDKWHVYHGDIATWKAPRQYDFIITDPPYKQEYLPLWETLAQRAGEWLKPNGMLIAMTPHFHLDKIMEMMGKHLQFYWIAAYLVPGESAGVAQRRINPQWKPLLIYAPANYTGKTFSDVFVSGENDKDNHKWGQSISGMYDIVSKICLPGQYILDPFCGAGTTGIAALRHDCLFDGLDTDIECVNISRGRLSSG